MAVTLQGKPATTKNFTMQKNKSSGDLSALTQEAGSRSHGAGSPDAECTPVATEPANLGRPPLEGQEDLNAVNQRLHDKVLDLETSNDDLNHLLASIDIATVFLDKKLAIKHFTLSNNELLALSFDDIGRPFRELAPNFNDVTMLVDAQNVLNDLTPHEKKITDGNGRWFLRRIVPYHTHGSEIAGVVITFAEITRLVITEQQLDRMNRLLNTLGEIDRTIVRSDNLRDIFNKVCHILVDSGKFRMAWVGIADHDRGTVTPVASAGITGDYLQSIDIRCDDSPQAQGPTGTAIRSAMHQINNDTEADVKFSPWRERARQMDYRASAAFPIMTSGGVVGAINVYAREPGAFGLEETRLLDEMAGTIGFALQSLDNIAQRSRAEAALQQANSELESRVAERTANLQQEIEERHRHQRIIEMAVAREKVLSNLLRLGLQKLTLDEYLQNTVTLLKDDAPWQGMRLKSAAFFAEHTDRGGTKLLRLAATSDAPGSAYQDLLLDIPDNTCLCGRTPDQECRIYGSNVTAASKPATSSTTQRPRYCAPIFSADGRAGILLFYLESEPNQEERTFLEQITDAMRLAISNFLVKTALLQANAVADTANKAKSEFLARMSHELRTPLNAILGFGQLLRLDHEQLSPDQQGSVSHILESGAHLLNLIDEVLDIAKVDAGAINLSIQGLSVADSLQSALLLVAPLAAQHAITIDTTNTGEDFFVYADPLRMKQIMVNLLSNAVKYNRPNGTVTIALSAAAAESSTTSIPMLRITVTDTGPGISPENQHRIFEPFQHITVPGNAPIDSIGVGLAITQKLVELMNGRIGVISAPGAGSSFWIELPMADPDAPGRGAPQPAPYNLEPAGKSKTILYIEDNAANLKLMQHLMARVDGYTLLSAVTAQAGIEVARAQVPDIILMDINLPDMDGYAALEKLRADPRTTHIPVIAVSAHAMPQHVTKGRQRGFRRYLTKPIDLAELLRALEEDQP